jgi:hypothetical protein
MEKGDKKKPIKPKTKRKYTKKSTNENINVNKINIKIGETPKPKRKYTKKQVKQSPIKSIRKGKVITTTIPAEQYDASNISHLYQVGQAPPKQPEKPEEIKIIPPKMEPPQPEVIKKPSKPKKGKFDVPIEIYVPSKPKTEFKDVNEPEPELLRVIPEQKPKKPIKIKKEKKGNFDVPIEIFVPKEKELPFTSTEVYPDDFFIPVNQEDEEVNVLSLQQQPESDLLKIGFTYKTQDTGFYDEPDEGELLSIQDLQQFITETIPSMFESQERKSMEQEDIKQEYMPFLSIKDIIDDEFRAKSQINELLGEMTSQIEVKQVLDDTIKEVETRMTTQEEDPLFVIEKEQREDDVIRDLSKYKPITSIPAGKIYNTETGRFVSIDGAKYKKDRFTIESEKYTDDLTVINEVRKSGLVNRGKYKKDE